MEVQGLDLRCAGPLDVTGVWREKRLRWRAAAAAEELEIRLYPFRSFLFLVSERPDPALSSLLLSFLFFLPFSGTAHEVSKQVATLEAAT